jgi:flotillin
LIAEAEAKKQTALGVQRVAELEATQIAQAKADAEKMRIEAEARARAEAIRITTVAQANAESIQKVNEAIKAGGESYFRYRQIEMIPEIAPVIADALAKARLVTISGDSGEGGAAQSATSNITSVIQTVLAAQLVSNSGMLQNEADRGPDSARDNGRKTGAPPTPVPPTPPPAKTGFR